MIRVATVDDQAAIADMARHFLAEVESYGQVIPADDAHIAHVTTTLLEKGRIFLAEVEGEPAGMLGAIVYPHFLTAITTANEIWWWVERGFRGRGVDEALHGQFEVWATSQGATRFEVGSRHRVLDRYYRRFGYREVERLFAKELR